jgi:hypothetical protein
MRALEMGQVEELLITAAPQELKRIQQSPDDAASLLATADTRARRVLTNGKFGWRTSSSRARATPPLAFVSSKIRNCCKSMAALPRCCVSGSEKGEVSDEPSDRVV